MEKKMGILELQKKELELFLNTAASHNPSTEGSFTDPNDLDILRPLLSHVGILEDGFRVESFPPKLRANNSTFQDMHIYMKLKDSPLWITIELTLNKGPNSTKKSKKINKGCSFESVVFSGSPDEEGLEPIFGFFNRRLSALRHKRPLYLRLLSSFLREVREWETTSQGVREALPSRSYEILERENEDGLLTFEFHLRGGEEEPFFALFWSMDITPLSVETYYDARFSEKGRSLAESYSFPEEIILGKRYGNWSAQKTLKELAKLTLLEQGQDEESHLLPTSSKQGSNKKKTKKNKK